MLTELFGTVGPVVGMIHLPALPGAPGSDGDRAAVRERAVADARTLASGGADAVLVENFGDAPFYPDDVPKHVVAEMTAATRAVREAVDLPVGVNVLRNDPVAALSVAAAAGGRFVRVNVHTGARVTDQGVIEGRAHETVRLRDGLDADVRLFADVHSKHSAPLGTQVPPSAAARDAVERGRADGVLVTGDRTGAPVDRGVLEAVAGAVGDEVPVFVGSGVTPDSVGDLLGAGADGVVVGSALKEGGDPSNPVSEARVERLVGAVPG